jgi:hypothetical protein
MRSLVAGSGRRGSLRGMVIAGVCTVAIVLTSGSTWAVDASPAVSPSGDPSATPSAAPSTTTPPTTAPAEPTVTATTPTDASDASAGLLTVDGPKPAVVEAPQSVPAHDIVVPPAAVNAATEGAFGAAAVAALSASS